MATFASGDQGAKAREAREVYEAPKSTREITGALEAGDRPLRFAEFMVLARVLKVSPEALLARVLVIGYH